MTSFRFHSLLIILYSLFFLLSSPALAKDCSRPTDCNGPCPVLFLSDNEENDCSFPPNGSPLDMNTIKNGQFKIQNVSLNANLHGDQNDLANLHVNASGQLNLTVEELSTFGLGPDIFSVPENRRKLQQYRKVIEAPNNYRYSLHVADAIADGVVTYEDFVAWACDRDLCIDGHVNPSVFSTASQLSSLEDQLKHQRYVAQEIVNCNQDSEYSNSHPCNNIYSLGNSNSLAVARDVLAWLDPEAITDSWSRLTPEQKFLTFGLDQFCAAPSFAVIVPQKANCSGLECIASLISTSDDQPGYIKFMVPGACTLAQGTSLENNRITPLKDQTPAAPTTLPQASNTSLLTELLAEIRARNGGTLECPPNTPDTPSENLGAIADPVKNTSIFSILSSFFTSASKEEAVQDKRYCVFVFSPPDVVAADKALGANPDALARKLEPLNTNSDFTASIDAPQIIESQGNGRSNNNQVCTRYVVVDGVQECEQYQDNYVAYTGGAPHANQPGRYALKTKSVSFTKAEPLNSTTNIRDLAACLVPWLARKAEASGFALGSLLSIDKFSSSLCPNPTKSSTVATEPGDCRQALFERGACPGGMDCIDYICANSGGLNCSLLVMIAANESGGLFSCDSQLRSIKHFGCDPWGAAGYDDTIAAKLQCAVNTLGGYSDLNAALQNYGYSSVNDLPWGMFGLAPATSLTTDYNNIDYLKSEIYGGNTARWWAAYCNRFPALVEETGQTADPAAYSCDRP